MSSHSSYWSDEDEVDVRIRHRPHSGHGRVSPQPMVYADPRRPVARPVYYTHGQGALVVPGYGGEMRRSSSTHRQEIERRSPVPPPPAPVIINNYNELQHEDEDDRYHLQLARPAHHRSRSHSRPSSFASSREDWELEKTRKELAEFKMKAQHEAEKERLKKELEYKKMKEEKQRIEDAARTKKETEEAVERWQIEQAKKAAREKKEAEETILKWQVEQEKKAAKEKKEKEEREKEIKERMESDMRKAGMSESQIAAVLKKEKPVEISRPTYTRMNRRHLSIETLNVYRIDYEFDQDPDYLLIKRWVPEHEQDVLWRHTREIRERRRIVIPAPSTKILMIEERDHHHHHKHKKSEPEFEFVRKKERRPSPSPLLTFLAGGKR